MRIKKYKSKPVLKPTDTTQSECDERYKVNTSLEEKIKEISFLPKKMFITKLKSFET